MKWHNNVRNGHRYQLMLTIEALSKVVDSQNEYAAFWLELELGKGVMEKSELITLR